MSENAVEKRDEEKGGLKRRSGQLLQSSIKVRHVVAFGTGAALGHFAIKPYLRDDLGYNVPTGVTEVATGMAAVGVEELVYYSFFKEETKDEKTAKKSAADEAVARAERAEAEARTAKAQVEAERARATVLPPEITEGLRGINILNQQMSEMRAGQQELAEGIDEAKEAASAAGKKAASAAATAANAAKQAKEAKAASA
jgi:hypothetical protein